MHSLEAIAIDEAAATTALIDYYRAFSTLDVQAILPFFHEPCMVVGPQGVFAADDHTTLAAAFTVLMNGLRAKSYGRSELNLQQLKPLSSSAILANGVALRYKTDGAELEKVGVTYILHKTDSDWKIAVLVTHDAQ